MAEQKSMKISMNCILACVYFLLLPTTIAINSAGNSYLKLATIPIAGYCLISIVFSKKPLHFNVVHLLLCAYTVSTLLTLFIKSDNNSLDTVVGYFLNAALYLCLAVYPYNAREIKLLENIQVLLLLILILITLFSNVTLAERTTLTIFGQTSDPNYFVGFFLFPFSVTVKKVIESKYRLFYILLVFLGMYCIFLSGSRGGLIAIVVMIAAFAVIYPPMLRTKLLLFFAGISFILVAWLIVVPLLPENIIERMSIQNVIETGGTGRWDIWMSMWDEVVNSPNNLLLGRGIVVMHSIFLKGEWYEVGAHSQLIQVLYNQGVVGLIMFLMLTIGCILRCIKKRKTVSIAIIGMMALSISLSFNQTTRTFWNVVAYAAMIFPETRNQRSTENLELPEDA